MISSVRVIAEPPGAVCGAARSVFASRKHRRLRAVPAAPVTVTVNVSASATATVANDRLQAWLRAEADNVSPAAAAAPGQRDDREGDRRRQGLSLGQGRDAGLLDAADRRQGQAARAGASRSRSRLEATDFAAAATLLSKLQDEDGLLLSGMGFSLGDKTRRDAEDAVTQEAIQSWQERAQRAAQGLGFATWRVGHVTVQTQVVGRSTR